VYDRRKKSNLITLMPLPENIYRNKAIVHLKEYCGWTYYAIAKALGTSDKRNITRVFNRDRNKYILRENHGDLHSTTSSSSRTN